MARGKGKGGEVMGHVNLTPMIDVVFQLIIFFMLVTELTNMALEQVVLPLAPHASDKPPSREGEVVVNIKDISSEKGRPAAAIIIFGQRIPGEGRELVKNLTNRLKMEAEAYGKFTPNHPSGKNSELELLVRADRQVQAKYFIYLMWACNDVGIYKVRVAARQFINQ